MVYRDREFVEDIGGDTRVRMSDLANLEDYSPNSREGWVLKALSSMGPTSVSRIDAWISNNSGPSGSIDSVWTMLDDGILERI